MCSKNIRWSLAVANNPLQLRIHAKHMCRLDREAASCTSSPHRLQPVQNRKLHAYMLCKYSNVTVAESNSSVASPFDRVGSSTHGGSSVFFQLCSDPHSHTRRLQCLVSQIVLLAHLRQRFLGWATEMVAEHLFFVWRLPTPPTKSMGRYGPVYTLRRPLSCSSSSPVKRAQCWSPIFASKRFRPAVTVATNWEATCG